MNTDYAWLRLDSNEHILLKIIAMILSAQVSQTRTFRHWAFLSPFEI
jgi:hypothetical protein